MTESAVWWQRSGSDQPVAVWSTLQAPPAAVCCHERWLCLILSSQSVILAHMVHRIGASCCSQRRTIDRPAEKNYQGAIDWFTKSIDLHPTAVVYSNRAFAHIKLEEYGSAIIDSTEAISLDPAYVKV